MINHTLEQNVIEGFPTFVAGATFEDTTASFATAGEGLRGRILEIIAGPGAGQSRQILSNTVDTLTLSDFGGTDWETPLTGASKYRIRMYDNLAAPAVLVRINDDDAPGLKVNLLNDDERIDVIEGGETDVLEIQLTRQPDGPVTVALDGGDQLDLSDSSLDFTVANWNTKQLVTVTATDDTVREGFHHGITFFYLTSGADTDDVIAVVDEEISLLEIPSPEDPLAGPNAFVGLMHNPLTSQPITVKVDPDGIGPEAEVVRDPSRYSVISNKVIFIDGSGLPEFVEGLVKVSYSWLNPGYDGYEVEPVVADIADNDYPGVLIRESDGSTDVIEGGGLFHPAPWTDEYTVVLTQQPTDDIKITITPEITKTTRAPLIRNDLVQVGVWGTDPAAQNDIFSGSFTRLTFTPGNWNVPQTVRVIPLNDGVVDGGDTKVFAANLHTLNDIQGPLFIDGAGGSGSLEGLNNPLMLPFGADGVNPETNIKAETGNVQSITSTTITALTADLLGSDLITTLDDLIDKTVEITEGPENGIGYFRLIVGYIENGAQTTLVLNEPWDLTPAEVAEVSKYAITAESLNFFVNEDERIDWLVANHQDSVADSSGVLTSYSLTGLGMGPGPGHRRRAAARRHQLRAAGSGLRRTRLRQRRPDHHRHPGPPGRLPDLDLDQDRRQLHRRRRSLRPGHRGPQRRGRDPGRRHDDLRRERRAHRQRRLVRHHRRRTGRIPGAHHWRKRRRPGAQDRVQHRHRTDGHGRLEEHSRRHQHLRGLQRGG